MRLKSQLNRQSFKPKRRKTRRRPRTPGLSALHKNLYRIANLPVGCIVAFNSALPEQVILRAIAKILIPLQIRTLLSPHNSIPHAWTLERTPLPPLGRPRTKNPFLF